jgi:LacI family transcriptional regulator
LQIRERFGKVREFGAHGRWEIAALNLKELSRHLGLSPTTVSRALNGFPEVGEGTRRRCLDAAQRFHYRPNANARNLATGRAGAVGVVISAERNLLLDPIFTEFLAGIVARGSETETDVLVSSTRGDDTGAYRRLARMRSVDAVILSTPALQDQRLALLARLGLPAVVHGRTESALPYAFLDIDNAGAFAAATGMLAGLGHRRIGLVNGDVGYTFAAHRRRGWRDALAARGLPAPPELEGSGAMTEAEGYRLARRLLGLSEPPTALLCSSIISALGAMRAARDTGLTIGRDLSLVAHDDGIAAIRPETLTPAVTTTFSSIRAAGARMAEMAIAVAGGADPASFREIWPVELNLRGSTVPPPARR